MIVFLCLGHGFVRRVSLFGLLKSPFLGEVRSSSGYEPNGYNRYNPKSSEMRVGLVFAKRLFLCALVMGLFVGFRFSVCSKVSFWVRYGAHQVISLAVITVITQNRRKMTVLVFAKWLFLCALVMGLFVRFRFLVCSKVSFWVRYGAQGPN